MNPITKLAYKAYTYYKYKPSKMLKDAFKHFPEADQYPQPSENIKNKKILFCPFAPHQLNIVREGIWAHSCAARGASVKMITYDLYLDAIDFINPNVKKDLSISYKISKKIYDIIKVPYIAMSDYADHQDKHTFDFDNMTQTDIENLSYKGIELSDLVIASSVRYFFCNGPEWGNLEFLNKARQFARTAVVLTNIYELILDEHKPDKIVCSHGIYVSWGTLFRMAREKNIPIDIYGASYRKNTLRFYHNIPQAPFPDGEWDRYKDIPLNAEQEAVVDNYFKSRETQKEDSIVLFDENSKLPDRLKNFISDSKAQKRTLFCIFTNISWDSFMYRKETKSFNNITEWLLDNIAAFRDKKNVDLIIKAHPAENNHNVPDKYRIKNCIPEHLPENIYFIKEDANVKAFDLYKYIDYGLVYTSTVCLEMALFNIPVLSSGVGGHYEGKGFTMDPRDQNEYFEKLNDLMNGNSGFKPNIEAAKRYMYFRFFREAIQNELIELNGFNINSIKFIGAEALAYSRNKNLDIITDGILNDSIYINS